MRDALGSSFQGKVRNSPEAHEIWGARVLANGRKVGLAHTTSSGLTQRCRVAGLRRTQVCEQTRVTTVASKCRCKVPWLTIEETAESGPEPERGRAWSGAGARTSLMLGHGWALSCRLVLGWFWGWALSSILNLWQGPGLPRVRLGVG